MNEPPPPRLLALDPALKPPEFVLTAERYSLGRSSQCDLVVPREVVSRLHAQIERDGPRYRLRDLGSANGTFVNGQRLDGAHLLSGHDVIGLGAATPVWRFDDPDPTALVARQLSYDAARRTFLLDRTPLELTPNQLRLFEHLFAERGRVCSREACAEAIWGRSYDPGLDAAALDRLVANLRAELRRVDPSGEWIETRRGLGYLLR